MTSSAAPTPTTPGWRFVYIGVDGPVPALGGLDPWKRQLRSVAPGSITVAHPCYPQQRHQFNVYELDGPSGTLRFATGEYSNCIWGVFVPASSPTFVDLVSFVAQRAGIDLRCDGSMQFVAYKDAPAFLDACAAEGVRVLGIEGFRLDATGVTPDMDAIADFSVAPGPGGVEESIRASRMYFGAVKSDLLFEFELDRPGA
jgi:hypothetical protein